MPSGARPGTTATWAAPSPAPRRGHESRFAGSSAGCRCCGRSGRPLRVRTRVHNLSRKPFPADATYGRRLVRLGAQLCAEDGTLMDRDFARARLPRALEGGSRTAI